MKICYLALNEESYESDLAFTMKMTQKGQTFNVKRQTFNIKGLSFNVKGLSSSVPNISEVYFLAISNCFLLQPLYRHRLKKIRGALSCSVIIITTKKPAPRWVKKYPKFNQLFVNGSFNSPQNYPLI